MEGEVLEDAMHVGSGPSFLLSCSEATGPIDQVVYNAVKKGKENEQESVKDSQPERDEDTDRIEVRPGQLADKQPGTLEVLYNGVDGLVNALLQCEGKEIENLSEIGWLGWFTRLVVVSPELDGII